MWWILAFAAAIVVFLFWPTARRRLNVQLHLASLAAQRRDWDALASELSKARKILEPMPRGPWTSHMQGELDLLDGHSAYTRGEFDAAIPRLESSISHFELSDSCLKGGKISMARHVLGDLRYDQADLSSAEAEFRAASNVVSYNSDAAMSIFSLQRLADVLLEQERFDDAREVVMQCVDHERKLLTDSLAKEGKTLSECSIKSMSAPDLALANRDFMQAEQLFQEKVAHWNGMAAKPDNVDVTRYQFHLATAQRELGRIAESLETLRRACQTAERDFGPRHPRVSLARRRLEMAEQAAQSA